MPTCRSAGSGRSTRRSSSCREPGVQVWPLEEGDVTLARQLHERHPELAARDLCHLASCRRRRVGEIMTFDRALGGVGLKPASRRE